ncbi:tyrosine-type recombinase/integrase [Halomonas sp. MCCC 1A11062]|uniref:tyrosine-type recombinase/integrase n=1 Tax=Halomonas sp. MCCC 1A11062 TaxID=2733485 RepID=UPI001F320B81|nr:tyrosine-type recombinase/integrase [Halomonas sp. MCCC 1A11062]MCE8039273.1 tyrosine-type recombinase/integrase [Halomonas sp. MCCC 1A11062]
MGKLTATQIKNLQAKEKDYRVADGNGLYLNVRVSGSKTFLYRDRSQGDTFVTLGTFPSLSLAEARADVAQRKLKRKRQKSVATDPQSFKAVAEEYVEANEPNWSGTHTKKVKRILERDIYPSIGEIAIEDVTSRDVLDIVKNVEKRAPTIAKDAKIIIGCVCRNAIIKGVIDSDPTAALKGVLSLPKTKHSASLNINEFKTVLLGIKNSQSTQQMKTALLLLAHTFVRSHELIKARWDEFDFDAKVWTIPAERMKNRRIHVVPLSRQVIKLLKSLPQGKPEDYIFPHQKYPNEHAHVNSGYSVIMRMNLKFKFSPHGFRSTASTMLNTKGYRSDLIERQLSHVDGNRVRASYNHSDYIDERRKMMHFWSDEIDRLMGSG